MTIKFACTQTTETRKYSSKDRIIWRVDLRYKLSERTHGKAHETKQLEEFPWMEDKL